MVTGMVELNIDAPAGAYVFDRPVGRGGGDPRSCRHGRSGHARRTRTRVACGQILVEAADTGEAEGGIRMVGSRRGA